MHTPYDSVPGWNTSIPCAGYDGDSGDSNAAAPFAAPDSTYCGMLWDADRYMMQIEQRLKAAGLWNNTLIVFSSDNGGVGKGINYPLRGEKHSNWEGGMRTAAFVSGGLIPSHLQGSSSDVVFHIADWCPTLCRLAGVSGSDDPPTPPLPVDMGDVNKDIYGSSSYPPVDGVDIWDILMNPQGQASDAAHAALTLSKEVLVAGKYKLLVAQPNFKTQNNGWKYPNGSWVPSDDKAWPCNAQDGPLTQVLPGVPGNGLCLFDLEAGAWGGVGVGGRKSARA